jgi:uncharacterized membrane protein HdeD (DUF308 family)
MNLRDKLARFERFGTDWRRLLARGAIMLSVGALLGLASLANPDATLMYAAGYSWLPAAALVVLAVGLLECLDAAIAKEQRDFFLHLQNGVLDVIVGSVIAFSVDADPDRLVLLIAAFLMVKGVLRMTLAQATQLPHKTSTMLGAGTSFLLGFLIWREWRSPAAWALAACLSAEIGFRGWALMMFAFWLKAQKGRESAG